jgi:hypothetical protein
LETLRKKQEVSAHLHYSIYKRLGFKLTDKWCTHTRAQRARTHTHTHTHTVCEHIDVTVLWNPGVHTDREVMANRPDVIKTKKKKHAY